MGRYKKKPVEIEAFKWTGGKDQIEDPIWIVEAIKKGEVTFKTYKSGYTEHTELFIHTLEGIMAAQAGDWIIRGVVGELYPCKPEIFEATYEYLGE